VGKSAEHGQGEEVRACLREIKRAQRMNALAAPTIVEQHVAWRRLQLARARFDALDQRESVGRLVCGLHRGAPEQMQRGERVVARVILVAVERVHCTQLDGPGARGLAHAPQLRKQPGKVLNVHAEAAGCGLLRPSWWRQRDEHPPELELCGRRIGRACRD
jgi:hypothetical protein